MRVAPKKPREGELRIPLSQEVVAGINLHRHLHDPMFEADRTRLILRDEEMPLADERLTSMGEMIMEANGGSLRTFSGNLAHENGWWPGWKRQRLQHWQGMTQRYALIAAESDFKVAWAQSEPCLLRFPIGDQWYEWYADLLVNLVHGPDELWEIKKDEQQLKDPMYRLKLAGVAEICRRIGRRFRLVMAEDIVENRHHRDNIETFASRRFVTIPPEHLRRFEAFAMNRGSETTYGELANFIDPCCPARGAAVIQGLTVRRRVEIDLRELLTNRTPLRIH
jgi:hypothetical protein